MASLIPGTSANAAKNANASYNATQAGDAAAVAAGYTTPAPTAPASAPVAPANVAIAPTVPTYTAPATTPVLANSTPAAGQPGSPWVAPTITGSVDAGSGTNPISSDAITNPTTDGSLSQALSDNAALEQTVQQYEQIPQSEIDLQNQAITAQNQASELNTSVLGANANIMKQPIALEFQQGQEAAVTRDAAFQSSALANTAQATTSQAQLAETQRQANLAAALQAAGYSQQQISNYMQQEQIAAAQTQVVQSGGNFIRYTFDANGNPVSETNLGPTPENIVQVGVDANGFPQYVDQNTGRAVSIGGTPTTTGSGSSSSSTAYTSPNQPGVVGGYDLGAGIAMGPYANASGSDSTNYNYAQEVGQIAAKMPAFTNAASIQQYIAQTNPQSPVTGAMIASSANKYGVNPAVLTAVLQQESSLGTAGAGAKTFNPGNVGNVNSGATVNYGSWQAGVDATAANLASRYLGTPSSTPQTTTASAPASAGGAPATPAPVTGASLNQGPVQQAVAQIAPLAAPYAQTLNGIPGAVYVDLSKTTNLPTPYQAAIASSVATAQANGAHLVALDATGVSQAKSIDEAKNILDQFQTVSNQVLGNGAGALVSGIFNSLSKIHVGSSTRATEVAQFDSLRDQLVQYAKTLSASPDSSASARVTVGLINQAVQSLPTIHSSSEQATTQINAAYGYLTNALQEIIPYAPTLTYTAPTS